MWLRVLCLEECEVGDVLPSAFEIATAEVHVFAAATAFAAVVAGAFAGVFARAAASAAASASAADFAADASCQIAHTPHRQHYLTA